MKFGFIAHPTTRAELEMLSVYRDLQDLELAKLVDFISEKDNEGKPNIDLLHFSRIQSLAGGEAQGKVTYIPLLAEEIIDRQEEALRMIIDAAKDLEAWGAEVIGLGAYTAVIGGRGVQVQAEMQRAVITTGNSFTTFTSLKTLELIFAKLNLELAEETVILVGFPGSIILALAYLLAPKVKKLVLVGRKESKYFLDLLEDLHQKNPTLELECCNEMTMAMQKGRVVMTATSTGNIIEQSWLKPGTVVIDIAEPKDMIPANEERSDILIVDGGRCSLHKGVQIEGMLGKFIQTGFYGCVAETLLLALEGRKESFSLGRQLPPEKVLEIGEIGAKHGFEVQSLTSWRKPVDDTFLVKFKKYLYQSSSDPFKYLSLMEDAGQAGTEEIYRRYSTYVNPIFGTVSKMGQFERKFTAAQGITLHSADGDAYYDFVGGYGAVNIGHNHPRLLEGIQRYFELCPPGLLQVVPGVYASALAENLALIAPGDLEMVFFCNSGTEAVEGALKLARIYTGRQAYVSAKNSFHGKSFGSLSVTAREKYQKYFRPLLPECRHVEYGSLPELEAALAAEDVAAVILEPIQGEGGVIVPPPGYLKGAQELCRRYGALLIADEVQTGFGRTGKMFACEHEGVAPDIMTVAKSLGGGLVPIGAYLTTRRIWEESYGNQEKYLLHTSTFGGNNFACAVGLLAIETIFRENLMENARSVGDYLRVGLRSVAEKFPFVKEVRGRGLMLGIEFARGMERGLDALIDTWMNSASPELFNYIDNVLLCDLKNRFHDLLDDLMVNIEQGISDNFATKVASTLLNDSRILTIVTLNNPRVMRIQPPLVITREIADYFIDSFDAACKKLAR